MSNFAFLKTQSAYASFAPACVEAEGIFGRRRDVCPLREKSVFVKLRGGLKVVYGNTVDYD